MSYLNSLKWFQYIKDNLYTRRYNTEAMKSADGSVAYGDRTGRVKLTLNRISLYAATVTRGAAYTQGAAYTRGVHTRRKQYFTI